MKTIIFLLTFLVSFIFIDAYSQNKPQDVRGLTSSANPKLKFQVVDQNNNGELEVLFFAENEYVAEKYYNLFQYGIDGEIPVLLVFDFKPGLQNGLGEYEISLNNDYQLTEFDDFNNVFGLLIGTRNDWNQYNFNKLMLYLDY